MKKQLLYAISILLTLKLSAQRTTVLIIADDLGKDYFGFFPGYGDTVDVPNIRFLANNGIVFTNNMSNPICSSTRASILTGRYGFRTGVGGVVGGVGGSNPIDTSEIAIPQLLKIYDPNIAKANIGKWHLTSANPTINLLSPLKLGFDHFEGPFIGQLPSFVNWTKYTNGVANNITTYATTENINNAVAWLQKQAGKPVFLWLAFNAPHEPLHLPPTSLHSFNTLTGTTADINSKPKSYFKAMIQAMDKEIGRLFDSLKAMNRFDSTDFIFIGDNGNTIRTAQITDLTKAKGTVYQYGVNTPMIVSGSAVVNKGSISHALVNTADIFATVLELQGFSNWKSQIPSNKPVDSKSILPIIKNTASEIRPWQFTEIFKLVSDSDDAKAIRNINYKLIRYNYGKLEFYNLQKDPLESNNISYNAMDNAERSNCIYLCNELSNLIGISLGCPTTGIHEASTISNISVYPNPFTKHIGIYGLPNQAQVELYNALGKCVYAGTEVEQQNFSDLASGIYFIKYNNKSVKIFKQSSE